MRKENTRTGLVLFYFGVTTSILSIALGGVSIYQSYLGNDSSSTSLLIAFCFLGSAILVLVSIGLFFESYLQKKNKEILGRGKK